MCRCCRSIKIPSAALVEDLDSSTGLHLCNAAAEKENTLCALGREGLSSVHKVKLFLSAAIIRK